MADSITSFEVYRSATSESGPWGSPIATLPGTARSYADSANPSPRFWYKLVGRTAEGHEIPYNIVSIGPNTWAKGFGGTSYNYIQSVAIDSQGNIIFVGQFAGTTDWGLGNKEAIGAPLQDMILCKYSPSGTPIWTQRFGGTGDEKPTALAVANDGSIFVVGSFSTPNSTLANFGGSNLTSTGLLDIFVVKYNSNGVFQWQKQFGNTNDDGAKAVAVDSNGDVLITGSFFGTGGINFGGSTWYGYGGAQIFIVKLSGVDGSHIWSKAPLGNISMGRTIAVDANGDVFVGASVNGPMDFRDGTVLTPPWFPYSEFVSVFMKLSGTDGSRLWAKLVAGAKSYDTYVQAVALDSSGNEFFTGRFTSSTLDFGNGVVATSQRPGNDCIFLVKMSGTDGTAQWVRSSGTVHISSGGIPYSIAVTSTGRIVIVGNFPHSIVFGNHTLTSSDTQDVFVVTYDADGNVLNAIKFGDNSFSKTVFGNTIAASDFVVVGGQWYGGSIDFAGTTLTNHSHYDAFLVKI